MTVPELDPEKVQHYAELVAASAQQSMNCALSFVGEQLGCTAH
ncbi:MAG: hypothetical protein O7G84_09315 [Gammaproteobacteria bacterium]|nr:hypothetical protein [Gammaproteobacteria bacterium]